ncbi:hypothetical protein J4760_00735 [Salinicoccus sp. ID82-1]|uniref:Uncharacterized protein n=1 Tax=Salinicoccus cyprini TaxID=2493691 RepID=A0A558AXS0_9STAP|nr:MULTISPECIES: hypothetical protein [Salinicoccus]MCG1008567.1 hypothetical protein [Salinicoccus sp. ID82-1]TVT29045.1 hypothetical protein FO441_01865 [Salinicoccus cyprini]
MNFNDKEQEEKTQEQNAPTKENPQEGMDTEADRDGDNNSKDKQSDMKDAAKEARTKENPAEDIDTEADRKVDKGKDKESDASGSEKTEEEIQDSFE